jgi:hypothetical protein
VVNVRIWEDIEAAKQMDSLQGMLAQRPIRERAGVTFDRIANDEPANLLGVPDPGLGKQ